MLFKSSERALSRLVLIRVTNVWRSRPSAAAVKLQALIAIAAASLTDRDVEKPYQYIQDALHVTNTCHPPWCTYYCGVRRQQYDLLQTSG